MYFPHTCKGKIIFLLKEIKNLRSYTFISSILEIISNFFSFDLIPATGFSVVNLLLTGVSFQLFDFFPSGNVNHSSSHHNAEMITLLLGSHHSQ